MIGGCAQRTGVSERGREKEICLIVTLFHIAVNIDYILGLLEDYWGSVTETKFRDVKKKKIFLNISLVHLTLTLFSIVCILLFMGKAESA